MCLNFIKLFSFLHKMAVPYHVFIENYKFSASGGISIGYSHRDYPDPAYHLIQELILGGDNFNREIKNQAWGKGKRLDVFHLMGLIKEVRAPPGLSRTKPRVPIEELTGERDFSCLNDS